MSDNLTRLVADWSPGQAMRQHGGRIAVSSQWEHRADFDGGYILTTTPGVARVVGGMVEFMPLWPQRALTAEESAALSVARATADAAVGAGRKEPRR